MALALLPFFEDVAHVKKLIVPRVNLLDEGTFEAGELHGLCEDAMLVDDVPGIIKASDSAGS